MAKVIAVGTPRNEAERQAIAYLRDHLPTNCTVIHNFELTQSKESFEIDLAVLMPQCVYVVDVKGVQGLVDIYGTKWYPEGREPYSSPLIKARMNARLLKAFITDSSPTTLELHRVYVRAAVVLTASDVRIDDHNNHNNDSNDIVRLSKSLLYFQDKANVPAGFTTDIRNVLPLVEKTITGKARKSQELTYREWQVEEKLGGNEYYIEYRARHLFTGKRGTARLRVYHADPYQDEATRKHEQKLISNAYRAISDVPGHPNILNVRDFFPSEDGSYFVLVTEDVHGQALRQHIKKASLALTFDQKLRVIRDVLTALEHAHAHQVVHRNLTPDAIIVSADGQARLSSFEYARVGSSATSTIAKDIVDDMDQTYQAPECFDDPSQASITSDLFSAGLVFYELLTGETAFSGPTQIYDMEAIFPIKPTELKPDLPPGLNEWLQKLCAFEPRNRFSDATGALRALQQAIIPMQGTRQEQIVKPSSAPLQTHEKRNLPREYVLGERFVVQERLGQGGFAVAYKVFDTLAEVMRVLKLVLTDHISVYQRLRQEYKTLLSIPEHPYVVKVIWADRLADGTPYMVFEYVDGLDVDKLVREKALSVEDAVKLAHQVAEGLVFLHTHSVYHQDIKPSNLLWTDQGVRIIDFNVSLSDQAGSNMIGGTGRYIPPDLVGVVGMATSQKIERDVYALGITLYECITGHYPFEEANIRKNPTDPYSFEGCEDLHPAMVSLMFKAIAPLSSERFATTQAFQSALDSLPALRKLVQVPTVTLFQQNIEKANYNPYVRHLLTLYSQSQYTNAGTRGLDSFSEQIYVETLLDKQLRPAILRGDFRLVIISGNAGDGKTAFIQQMAKDAEQQGAVIEHQVNGYAFSLHGRTFLSNYDGSQDEGEKTNDEVLFTFLTPFTGADEQTWSDHETRLIAINEGRLIDFLTEYEQHFPRLIELVRAGLNGQAATGSVAVINLNLRSVVAGQDDGEHIQEEQDDSIFDRLLRRMTSKQFWEVCESCDLKQSCYIYHNARTFMDPVAGSRTIERLKTLYTITHLRGQLHITLRDLRSSLAYMLVGIRDCDEVHSLYREGTPQSLQQIFDGYYFNAWMGGATPSKDRLIALLREIDVGESSNPDLDRGFDFLKPTSRAMARFSYVGRNTYDDDLLEKYFKQLPREYVGKTRAKNIELHKHYVAMLRRRHYFECRDDRWREMLPYHYYENFYNLVTRIVDPSSQIQTLLQAINRGEGLIDATGLNDALALRVRRVERGTIQSYRLFSSALFTVTQRETRESIRFVEHLSQFLTLSYRLETSHIAELRIYLDMYEMLMRLHNGYRPNPEELQGFYLSLMIFKNVLTSAPYQDVLLTETGHEFYKVSRSSDGILSLTRQRYNGSTSGVTARKEDASW